MYDPSSPVFEVMFQEADPIVVGCTLQGTNISPKNVILKMIFLFPRWYMLIPWRVTLKGNEQKSTFQVGSHLLFLESPIAEPPLGNLSKVTF